MKKVLLFAALAAMTSMVFTSCSNDDDVVSVNNAGESAVYGKPGLIGIKPLVNGIGGTSRATAITGANYLSQTLVPDMKVWGYFSHNVTADSDKGIAPGAQYVGLAGDAIVIDNTDGAGAWGYHNASDQAYWPSAALNFYAMLPNSNNTVVTSVEGTVGSSNLAHVVADVVIPEDNADQIDVMFGKSTNQTRTANANTPVELAFDHALTQVVFSGKCAAEKISVEVEDIKICNADKSGKVGYLTDSGTDVVLGSEVAATRTFGKYSAGLVADASLDGAVNKSTVKNLTAADGALMLLPQVRTDKWGTAAGSPVSITTADAEHQVYLAITCKIKNDNIYLVGGASSYETVYIPFEMNWQQGKKYNYTLIFGAGAGAFDEDGNPLDSMLPITYTVSAPTEWTAVNGGDLEF